MNGRSTNGGRRVDQSGVDEEWSTLPKSGCYDCCSLNGGRRVEAMSSFITFLSLFSSFKSKIEPLIASNDRQHFNEPPLMINHPS